MKANEEKIQSLKKQPKSARSWLDMNFWYEAQTQLDESYTEQISTAMFHAYFKGEANIEGTMFILNPLKSWLMWTEESLRV